MIKIQNITKKYGDKSVLRGVTCDFEEGKVTSIVAPNGSGKTTLMSIVSGLLIPDGGTIDFPEKWGPADVSIVFAGEKNLYMKNTVLENLLYFGIIQGMKKCEIVQEIERYRPYLPFLWEVRNQLAESLSYGQKRLVAIFSAIVTNAKCIMIDEASEGLDMEYAALLTGMLRKSAENRVILLASHDYSFVSKISDRILFLKDGLIFEEQGQMSQDGLQKRYREIFDLNLEDEA
jgi:ABC-type multidrug transport system ATPase subunit